MKFFIFSFLTIALFSCSAPEAEPASEEIENEVQVDPVPEDKPSAPKYNQEDLSEIEQLTRNAYVWYDERSPIEPEPILDSVNDVYNGLNLSDLEIATEDLSSTGFFTKEFVENYSKIYTTIDQKLRSGEMTYEVGTYPPYGSGADPWCNCQDIPYDDPSPWEEIDVEMVSLTDSKGEFYWKWKGMDPKSDWGKRRYHFTVEKVDGKWKISYLEGFNFDEYTRTKS